MGHGKAEFPFLVLYSCRHCHTLGSTWIYPDKIARCRQCYDDALTMLPDDTRRVNCPQCGEPGVMTPKEGSWE